MKKICFIVIVVVFLFPVVSCDFGKQRKEQPSGNSSPAGVPAAAQNQGAAANRQITILPERPGPDSDLQVLTTDLPDAIFRWEKNGTPIQGANGTQLSKTMFSKGDRITVTATSGGHDVSVSVQIGNTPPVVTSVSIRPESIYHGVDLEVTPVGFDADGDNVSFFYKWYVNGQDTGEHTSFLKGSLFKKGDKLSLVVVPSDSAGDGEPYTAAPLIVHNAPPRFTTEPVAQVMDGFYEYNVHAEDPDGDRVTYSLAAAPNGMVIDPNTGRVTWQVGREQAGDHAVEIGAQDDTGLRVIQKYTLTITVGEEQK